jgi:hypothetical protein
MRNFSLGRGALIRARRRFRTRENHLRNKTHNRNGNTASVGQGYVNLKNIEVLDEWTGIVILLVMSELVTAIQFVLRPVPKGAI